MAEELTAEQRCAVENRGGALLVSAAAGSGKTKVLVDRLLSYILDPRDPANIDDFLIITYTKAAAAELRAKIGSKLTERLAQMPDHAHLQRQLQRLYLAKISTVHSFCGDILREYAYKLDLFGDFRVGDENECAALRQEVMDSVLSAAYDDAAENEAFRTFVDTQGFGRDDHAVSEILLKVYDSSRCHPDPEHWLDQCLADADAGSMTDASQTVWGERLIKRLFDALELQIPAYERMEKLALEQGWASVAQNLAEVRQQLIALRQQSDWDGIHRRQSLDYPRLSFPRKNVDEQVKEQIKAVRDFCKGELAGLLRAFSDPSERIFADLEQTKLATEGMIRLVRAFRDAYAREKKRRRVLDFSDLEHRMLDLLMGRSRSGATQAAREIGGRFREILVDEYQDSNEVQDMIFAALTGQKNNCFMVGDVKQSIYRFRLADPDIFLEKYNSFAPAAQAKPGEGRTVYLCRNFRSGAAVLEAANDVFRLCMSDEVGGLCYTDREALVEGVPHQPLGEPEVELHVLTAHEETYAEEARFTARRIRELTDGTHFIRQGESLRPITPGDIVILLRSPNSVGGAFRQALQEQGIRWVSDSGKNLLETPEIFALRSVLQTISNPHQDIPLVAALASPVFGFTADELALIRGKNKKCDFFDALSLDDSEKTRNFLQILANLRVQARHVRICELIAEVFRLTGLDQAFAAMENGEERLNNLRFFYRYAADFEAAERRDLDQFLDQLTMMEESGMRSGEDQPAADAVRIMSIHKSKGLEFPVVFLCGLAKSFNLESARSAVLCDSELGLGLSAVDGENRVRYPTIARRALAAREEQESISEEMRVLYVAMTRAKDRLIMTYADRYLQSRLLLLSQADGFLPAQMLAGTAQNPGRWVLMTALRRTEAGELFALGNRPAETKSGTYPWLIRVHEPEAETITAQQEQTPDRQIPESTLESIRAGLSFQYAHQTATRTPSKQTATQLKGRLKDQEAAEQAQPEKRPLRTWRKPAFIEAQRHTGAQAGTATHAAMQFIRYESCGSLAGVREELQRLAEERLISREQLALIHPEQLAAFFASPLGEKLRAAGKNVLREFKFSVLDSLEDFGADLEGEQVLLQGVVDCALDEPDGLTVLDFKTDYVTEQTLAEAVRGYAAQVQIYAGAMSRIFEKPVKKAYLYFFRLNRLVEL